MKQLLILGAGGYGRTVAQAATHQFTEIAFLDDNAQGDRVLGTCAQYASFCKPDTYAYPAFGDNALRAKWIERLSAAGFRIPTIVHPRAYVSPTARLAAGVVVLAQAAVGEQAVLSQGVIVNMGAIADHDCVLGACVHLAPGAIVKAGCTLSAQIKVESGMVVDKNTAFLTKGGIHV